jgi:hypothetical protein
MNEALALPGMRTLTEEDVSAATNGTKYVFVRRSVQRNLFRIQVK